MGVGSITWTCLLLASAASGDVWHMNHRGFQIPIQVHPNRQRELRELRLFVSRDRGHTWQEHTRTPPHKKFFSFVAPADGTYWFKVAVVDRAGNLEPRDPTKGPVGQRVVVDTRKPDLKLARTERRGNKVFVSWAMDEENVESSSFRLEYRSLEALQSRWIPLPVMPGARGEETFKPKTPGALALRVRVKDKAGNSAQDQVTVQGSGVAYLPAPSVTRREPGEQRKPSPSIHGEPNSVQDDPTSSTRSSLLRRQPMVRHSSHEVAVPSRPRPAEHRTPEAPTKPPVPPEPLLPSPVSAPITPKNPDPSPSEEEALLPDSKPEAPAVSDSPKLPPDQAVAPIPTEPTGSLPPVRIVSKRQMKLDFDVTHIGPSGLGGVDVYYTIDKGETWKRYFGNPHAMLPAAKESRGAPIHGSVLVRLDQEGVIYGFYIVVKSRAGLGQPPPKQGQAPQILLEMDTSLPQAELYSPQPDTTRRDTLILTWTATDRNLAPNPITLEWATSRDGPWNPIGEKNMPNSGSFTWRVPDNIAPRVHLKLSVADTAGNVAVAQTNEPILIDLSIPKVGNVGLSNP